MYVRIVLHAQQQEWQPAWHATKACCLATAGVVFEMAASSVDQQAAVALHLEGLPCRLQSASPLARMTSGLVHAASAWLLAQGHVRLGDHPCKQASGLPAVLPGMQLGYGPRSKLISDGVKLAAVALSANLADRHMQSRGGTFACALQELLVQPEQNGAAAMDDHPLSQADNSAWKVYFKARPAASMLHEPQARPALLAALRPQHCVRVAADMWA